MDRLGAGGQCKIRFFGVPALVSSLFSTMIEFAVWLITPDREIADKWYRRFSRECLNVKVLPGLFAVAGILIVKIIPALLFSSFIGAFVDRFDRRKVMVLCDIGRACLRGLESSYQEHKVLEDVFRDGVLFVAERLRRDDHDHVRHVRTQHRWRHRSFMISRRQTISG